MADTMSSPVSVIESYLPQVLSSEDITDEEFTKKEESVQTILDVKEGRKDRAADSQYIRWERRPDQERCDPEGRE